MALTARSISNEPGPTESDKLKAKLEGQNAGEIIHAIYADREFRPIWTLRDEPLPVLQQFFQIVDDRSHGVNTNSFVIDALRQEHPVDPIQFDIDVTAALVKFARAVARQDADLQRELIAAIRSDSITELPDRLEPIHPEYAKLRAAWQTASIEDREKIELNMERWRKISDDLGERYIRVNIPAFELEARNGDEEPLRMKVIVGANENKTPLFSSDMKVVVFSPYWNIPESILTKETLPKIRKDPGYASKEHYEVVRILRKSVEVIDPEDIDWDNVKASDIQLRQRPGSTNSLGLVKFLFPNRYNVYLHDTPAGKLFNKPTRNFSHGCIRVEKPLELAEWVLRNQQEWTRERILAAMRAGQERQVALKDSIPVYILYFTAWVDDNGTLQIAKDIYGYDVEKATVSNLALAK